MTAGKVLYIRKALLPNSSEWHLAEHHDGVPDLLPTQGNNAGGKVTANASKKQGKGGKSSVKEEAAAPTDNADKTAYTITPATYTNKKGKTSDVSLLTFNGELTADQERAVKEFAKERLGEGRFAPARGWKDRESGGWMFRSEEDARKAAEMVGNEETVGNTPEKAKEVKGLSNKLKDRYPTSLYLLGRDISDMEEMVANGEVSPKRVERVRSEIKRLNGLLADYERLATPEERSWRDMKAEHPDEIVVVDNGNGLLVVCQEDVKATQNAIGLKLDAPVTENLIVTTNEEKGMPFTTMRVTLADLQRLSDKGVKYVVLDKNGNQAKEEREKKALHPSSVESKDNQGNPLNADGTLKLEKVKSVDDLTDEDFLKPYRNVELPKLPRKVDEAIGANGQPVVIKKNIFERNAERHNDLTSSQSREILHSALYNPDLYGQSQKAKRPYNWVVINTKDEKGHNRTVLLEINPNKDNIEIVHWHYVDERGLEKIKRQAEREDGQLLILPSAKEEAGALSSPTSGLSSDGKDANNSDNLQEKDKTFSERLQNAIAETEPNPSEAQKKAGNYKKGHLSFGGYDFTVEIPKGAIRSGKDEQGKPWSVTMHDTYGYILGKIGVDGDHIDMFINDDADLDTFDGNVYVVDQVNPETGEFDEHKVMYGYPSEEAATEAYLANYSKGWKGLGKVTSVPKATFDKWLESSDRKTKPFREYVMVQKETEGNKPSEASLSLSTPLTDEEVVKELTESKVLWNRFRGDSNSLGENQGSALTPSANNPSGKDSVLNPHSDAKIRNNIETANGNGGENTGKARQHKADAEYKKAKIKFSKVSNEQAKLDADYLDAVNRGDMETAQRMVNEAAEAAGYSTDSSYQGTSAFNGAAPWGNGYFLTKEERKEAWDNGDFEGESTLGDYINDGIDGGNLEDLTNAASYRAAGPMRKEAIDNVRNAIQKKSKTITMYRSVPSDVKEGKFRNGDWVTPSRAYAVDNAKVHGWGNDYNIIEQKVPVDEVWFDGNDIAEWGYGREEDYIKDTDFAYKNTKNNRKLLDVVTYDDNGNIIPLSQRFNSRKADERYQRGVDGVKPSKAEVTLRDAVIDKLRESGIEVLGAEGQKVLDMANGKDVRLEAKRKRALETASLRNNLRSLTVIPSADGAKVLKKIDILTKELEKLPTQSKTFTGDVAKALGAKRYGSSSEYATFETKNGKVVTIRLSNHNAKMAVLEDTVEKLEQERAAAMSQAVDEEQQHKVQETLDWFAAKISVFSKEEEINTRSCCISFDSYIKPQPRFSPGYISWSTSAHSVNSLLDRKPTTYPSGVPSVSLSGAG